MHDRFFDSTRGKIVGALRSRGAASAFTVAGLWSFATAREPRIFGVRVGYKF